MNRLIPSTALVLAALAAATTIAVAAPGDRGAMRGQAPEFSELDANGDGVITSEDLGQLAQARFAAIDADGDGQISAAEMTAAAEQRADERRSKRVDAMIERLDTDGNGTLSADEMTARDRASRLLDRADTNDDGEISQAEFDAAGKSARMHGGHGKGPRGE